MKLEYPWLLLLFIPYAAVLFMGWTLRAPSIRVPGLAPFRRAAGGTRRVNWRKLIPFVLFAVGATRKSARMNADNRFWQIDLFQSSIYSKSVFTNGSNLVCHTIVSHRLWYSYSVRVVGERGVIQN